MKHAPREMTFTGRIEHGMSTAFPRVDITLGKTVSLEFSRDTLGHSGVSRQYFP
jgi:hypothetical protein